MHLGNAETPFSNLVLNEKTMNTVEASCAYTLQTGLPHTMAISVPGICFRLPQVLGGRPIRCIKPSPTVFDIMCSRFLD